MVRATAGRGSGSAGSVELRAMGMVFSTAGCTCRKKTAYSPGVTRRVPSSRARASLVPKKDPSVTSIAVRPETLPMMRTPAVSL